MSDVRFHVKRYLDEGRVVLPVKPGEKATRFPKWQIEGTKPTLADFQAEDNVAERLDSIVDVDPDTDETRAVAPALLLRTERKHSRPSRGVTHYWFFATGSKDETFKDTDGTMLIEIRTGRKQYTLIPPSRVAVSKDDPSQGLEELFWDPDRAPATVDAAGLRHAVRSVATAALVIRHWPKSGRHNALLAIAGFLSRYKVHQNEAIQILSEITRVAEGEVWTDCEPAVRDTYAKLKEGKTTGGPALENALGKEAVAILLKWYGGTAGKQHDDIVEELNKNHFVTRMGKDTVIGTEDEGGKVVFQAERALFSWYSDERVVVAAGKKDGPPLMRSKFELWRENPARRKYREVTFCPPPRIPHKKDYNLWTGLAIEPADGDCSLFLDHIKTVLCSGNEEHYEYLMNYLAFTVQQPGIPSEVAVVLKGKLGTGKGIFVRNFGKLFGKHYVQLDRAEHLTGKFNASISAKCVVFADEAFFAGDKAHLGTLKRIISEETFQIERKGIDANPEDNNMHLFMATNEHWSIPAGFKERRFLMLSVSDVRMQDHAYFDAVQQELNKGGLAAFLKLLLARPVTHDIIRKVPLTDELRIQQEHTMDADMKWWKQCLELGTIGTLDSWPTYVNVNHLFDDYLRWCDQQKINRRVTPIDMARRVLKPWLGGTRREKMDGGAGPIRLRRILDLISARKLFDKETGTNTPWDDVPEEPAAERVETGDVRQAGGARRDDDLPF